MRSLSSVAAALWSRWQIEPDVPLNAIDLASMPNLLSLSPPVPTTNPHIPVWTLHQRMAAQDGEPENILYFPVSELTLFRAKIRVTTFPKPRKSLIELVSTYNRPLGRFYYLEKGQWQFRASSDTGPAILTDREKQKVREILKLQVPNEMILPFVTWSVDETTPSIPTPYVVGGRSFSTEFGNDY
jgi:hypothetical protein